MGKNILNVKSFSKIMKILLVILIVGLIAAFVIKYSEHYQIRILSGSGMPITGGSVKMGQLACINQAMGPYGNVMDHIRMTPAQRLTDPNSGCKSAVWSNGKPSRSYCLNEDKRFPWYSKCCEWNGQACIPRAADPERAAASPS